MAQSVRIEINEGHKLYKYCDRLTKAAGALWNAALSRITHGAAMCGKRESVMTAAERRVWNELMAVLPIIRSEPWFVVSPAVFLDSVFMNDFLAAIGCEEYVFPFLPRSSARYIVKNAAAAVRNYRKAIEAYEKSKKKSQIKPQPPKETKRGGRRSVTIHRDECAYHAWKRRNGEEARRIGLPLAKRKRRVDISGADAPGQLAQVTITPKGGGFELILAFEKELSPTAAKNDGAASYETPVADCRSAAAEQNAAETALRVEWDESLPNALRVCAIDTGTDNLAAITNNVGEPCFLLKKEMLSGELSRLRNEIKQMRGLPRVKPHIIAVERGKAAALLNTREIHRTLDMAAKIIIDWCARVETGTIFCGTAALRRQLVRIDTKSNASFYASVYNFISAVLIDKIRRKAAASDIQFVAVDEAYTSLASFPDGDAIPSANSGIIEAVFSGKRVTQDKYRTADGTYIHADLNASANIARKACPSAFAGKHTPPDFDNIIVITDPFTQRM